MNDILHIIWDLDGTLIDSELEALVALKQSFYEAGVSVSDNQLHFRPGPTIDKIIEKFFSKDSLSIQKKNEIIERFRKNYDNCGFNNIKPFDGIENILNNNQFVHHIITNKPDLPTKRILKKLGWDNYFTSVVTPYTFMNECNDKRKSKTELFRSCIADYPKERFVGIGDMETDIIAALDNNIPAIGVLWGTGTKKELEECDSSFIVSTLFELQQLLQKIKNL